MHAFNTVTMKQVRAMLSRLCSLITLTLRTFCILSLSLSLFQFLFLFQFQFQSLSLSLSLSLFPVSDPVSVPVPLSLFLSLFLFLFLTLVLVLVLFLFLFLSFPQCDTTTQNCTYTHGGTQEQPARALRSCLSSNVCAERTCPFPPPRSAPSTSLTPLTSSRTDTRSLFSSLGLT